MTKVTLRRKIITGDRESLYLDFYPPITNYKTGKETRRKFLRMFLYLDKEVLKKKLKEVKKNNGNSEPLQETIKRLKPLSFIEQKHNEETLVQAQSIQQNYQNEVSKPEVYTDFEKEQIKTRELGERCFIEYSQKLTKKRKGSNYDNWATSLKYLVKFTGGSIKFNELNPLFFDEYKEYLLSTNTLKSTTRQLSQNSAVSYFNKAKATLKQAYKDGLIKENLNEKVKPISEEETIREYLTLEELNALVKTPCKDELLKTTALFSALTGLRFSDIQKLKWSELKHIADEGYFISFIQQKTKGVETLPISEQAYDLTNGEKDPNKMPYDERVFKGLKYSAYKNKILNEWIKDAGINKKITFHCFRHTFATLQLFNGTDIYTVSKMLGHKDLKTTQIYAKIVDESKRTATNRIKLDLD